MYFWNLRSPACPGLRGGARPRAGRRRPPAPVVSPVLYGCMAVRFLLIFFEGERQSDQYPQWCSAVVRRDLVLFLAFSYCIYFPVTCYTLHFFYLSTPSLPYNTTSQPTKGPYSVRCRDGGPIVSLRSVWTFLHFCRIRGSPWRVWVVSFPHHPTPPPPYSPPAAAAATQPPRRRRRRR